MGEAMRKTLFKRFWMPAGDRRREPREDVSGATAEIMGDTYPLKNWSRGGFLATSCTADYVVGDELDARFSIPIPGRRLDFACRAAVVRVERDEQNIAGVFEGVDAATQAVIDAHFGVDAARVKSTFEAAGSAREGVESLSAAFPDKDLAEVIGLALEVCREAIEKTLQTVTELEAMNAALDRAPDGLDTPALLDYLAEQGGGEGREIDLGLSPGLDRRLSDQVIRAVDQAVDQGRDHIAEQLMVSRDLVAKEDTDNPQRRREDDKDDD